jgi:multiple antibiotic resistance protein
MLNQIFSALGHNILLLSLSLSSSSFLLPSLHLFIDNLVKSTIALFVVIDPIGSVPLFIALTEKMRKDERKAVSKTAIVTAAALLVVFAVAGTQILDIFGITIFSFMIAGGILLFIVSIELLTHGVWRFGSGRVEEEEDRVGKTAGEEPITEGPRPFLGESGVVPLAFPLLAGPGAITSVIISFQTSGLLVTVFSIAIVIGVTYVVLAFVNTIYRILGRRGSMIITRVFAVFIAAIAVQYIVQGAKQLLHT